MLIVACVMLSNSTSIAVRNCWILAGTGTCCCTCRASRTCSMGDMMGEYAAMEKLDICSFQELCTDPCDEGLWIIMLKHEVMAAVEWHDNGPQDLDRVTLCI